MNLKTLAAAFLAATVVLGACSSNSTDEATNEENSSTETETQKIRQLVQDYSVGNLKAKSASITSHELIITESEGKKTIHDISKEDFFVSIAPYVNETHP